MLHHFNMDCERAGNLPAVWLDWMLSIEGEVARVQAEAHEQAMKEARR